MAEDYSKLSYEELSAEIKRETDNLKTLKADLTSAEIRKAELEAAITAERLPVFEDRIRRRAERIRRYERAVAELESQISRFEDRLKKRSTEISRLETRIKEIGARLPYVSPVERYIRREVIRRLRRTVIALRGWQTRDKRYLTLLHTTLERNRRILAALRGWQTREAPLTKRLEQLRLALATTTADIERLEREITVEEARLEKKRKYLPKFYKAHIIISVQYKMPPHQKFFEIHIIMPSTVAEITEKTDEAETAITLAIELILKYFAIKALDESKFLRKNEFVFGTVQTSPVRKFNKVTECCIFDVKTHSVARQYFKVYWAMSWVETTLTGERITHPITYTRIEVVEKNLSLVTPETFKHTYNGLVKEEET